MKRFLVATAAAVLAAPIAAHAQPTRFQIETTLHPGERVALTVGNLPRGEFRFALRASSDGEKRFGLTQQRGVAPRFAVLNVPSAFADSACQGAAGSVFCNGISTPAPIAGSSYTFRLKNKSNRPLNITLTIVWRKVGSAG